MPRPFLTNISNADPERLNVMDIDPCVFAAKKLLEIANQSLTTRARSAEYVSTKDPEKALRDPQIAAIFRYYIEHLAGCPFLCAEKLASSQRHSTFAAASQSSSFLKKDLWDVAESYHLESVQALLQLTENPDEFRTGETLAAICLLRSYEIISQNISCQNHLQGSYSLLASRPAGLETGLLSAGFWNYLREDITVALIEKRSLMIELSHEQLPPTIEGEDDHANRITYLLGKVINRCLDQDASPLEHHEWHSLSGELGTWRASLPASFEPIDTPGLYGQSSFPCLWTVSGWHASSLQYYHTALAILSVAEPMQTTMNTLQQIDRINDFEKKLDHHAIQVSALAIFSNSAPVWVNSFGPISFCGPWLKDSRRIHELIEETRRWGSKTGWPVMSIVESLSRSGTLG
ncbi:hypothetical protein ANOM_006369 [Aspergillus nomiae NRRL 13137]|uniref:Uncharacterized protein n=1 Tax=Aspergillus nomiae NRRL (strain ATCC 15546 / NRRL 13137 / CBS 260.88 / M93) TaxID=1509407 RepID=A0A0L1J0V7_ASPN3|nr:uncharacterized protein ANOM_006369 [Aspergillus nomiae NRRL 13137]KNG85295.1 hypothetical protein ANOM_006369 [Aspergillus nomiae NRRL 13137]